MSLYFYKGAATLNKIGNLWYKEKESRIWTDKAKFFCAHVACFQWYRRWGSRGCIIFWFVENLSNISKNCQRSLDIF